MDNSQLPTTSALFAVIALLLPAGFILLAGGGLAGRRPAKSAAAGLGALAMTAIAYWACGFAFHLGGAGLVTDLPGLEGLVWEWASPLNLEWGVLGLRGFLMLEEAATSTALALYLAYLPPLVVAVLLPQLSLRERMPGWMAALGGLLVAGLVYPMVANWFSGGGWLMHTGYTLGQGHGYIDLIGLSTAAYVGGLAALLGILIFGLRLPPLPDGSAPALPPVHLPVLAVLGAFLVVVGGMALVTANPTITNSGLLLPRTALNLVLAAAAGAFLPYAYTWFTTSQPDPLMAARGATVGVVSVAGALAFIPPWAALALGGLAGLLAPLTTFLVRYVLRIEDPTGALPVGLLGGSAGILAVGFLGDGRVGAGWNGIGHDAYLGVNGQGVTGLIPAAGHMADWPGQINAQLTGLAAITIATLVLVGGLFFVLKVLLLLWRAIPSPERNGAAVMAESVEAGPDTPDEDEAPDEKSDTEDEPLQPDSAAASAGAAAGNAGIAAQPATDKPSDEPDNREAVGGQSTG